MPPVMQSSLLKPGSFLERGRFRLSPRERRGLLLPGSLSSRLQQWCEGNELQVTLIRQGPGAATRDEAHYLGLGPRERVWVREVRLGPPLHPWVQGRTVSPLKTMPGPIHYLRNLGQKPLGSLLFTGRGWCRSPFLIGVMKASGHSGYLPARRSQFLLGQNRLLVTEGFYPAYWERLRQAQEGKSRPDSPPIP